MARGFADKYNRKLAGTDYGYNWTAVSRTPWLFALGLWPSRDGAYAGGGRFLSNNHLRVLNSRTLPTQHPDHRPPRELTIEHRSWSEFRNTQPNDFEDAQWVGQDQFGRTVVAYQGKLFRHQGGEVVQLIDLNHREPDPQPAPIWARHK